MKKNSNKKGSNMKYHCLQEKRNEVSGTVNKSVYLL